MVSTGIPFPVICTNTSCDAVWFAPHIVGAGPNKTVHMEGNIVSPCPICGGVGRIPDGDYTIATAKLFRRSDLAVVLSAINDLRERASAGASTKEIDDAISKDYPLLEILKRYLPKNPVELAAYLAIIAATLSQCSFKSDISQTFEMHIQVEIRQVLEQTNIDDHSTD